MADDTLNANHPAEPEGGGIDRRSFLRSAALLLGLGGTAAVFSRAESDAMVWQLDPERCIQCGRCATACVLTPSAVKCVHAYAMCGYCELCGGYHRPDARELDTAAENQLCPTAAITRTFIEDPFYQYTIDEALCIGCGKCVKGCEAFGNGSLFLQVRHDRCVDCNECAIARACPADAFRRVPARDPHLYKSDIEPVAPEETS